MNRRSQRRFPGKASVRSLWHPVVLGFSAMILFAAAGSAVRADTVELLSGATVEGEVVARDDASVTLRVTVGGRTYTRKYPTERIHALVVGGKREVLNAKEGAGSPAGSRASRPGAKPGGLPGRVTRSRAEIEALFVDQG
ncbi:MAG: hypothetical protein NUV77_23915, partial [Thermoguttaceae bacterium]|nr:hypothetical protein [Thermoguttaceae bacterium]